MLWRTSSWCSIVLYSGNIGECSKIASNSKVRMSRCLDTSSATYMAQIVGKYWRFSGTSWTKFVGSSVSWIAMGKTIRRSFIRIWMGEITELGMHVRSSETGYPCQYMWIPYGKKILKHVDIDEPTSFLDHVHLALCSNMFDHGVLFVYKHLCLEPKWLRLTWIIPCKWSGVPCCGNGDGHEHGCLDALAISLSSIPRYKHMDFQLVIKRLKEAGLYSAKDLAMAGCGNILPESVIGQLLPADANEASRKALNVIFDVGRQALPGSRRLCLRQLRNEQGISEVQTGMASSSSLYPVGLSKTIATQASRLQNRLSRSLACSKGQVFSNAHSVDFSLLSKRSSEFTMSVERCFLFLEELGTHCPRYNLCFSAPFPARETNRQLQVGAFQSSFSGSDSILQMRKCPTWRDMLKNALNDTASWQTKRQSSCTEFQALAWMIINSKRMSLNQLEKYQKYAHKIVLICLQACTIDHKMDQSLWQRLSRLISYIQHTCEYKQYCSVGDTAKECRLGLFQDSDFAGDLEDSKSNSGGTLCTFGSHTFVPISWMCEKQTAVSHSSTKSEIISLDAGLRLDGIPTLDLWDLIVSVLGNTIQTPERPGDPLSLTRVKDLKGKPTCWTQSQTLLAERRSILYSTEIHWRIQNYKNKFGCYARTPHRW